MLRAQRRRETVGGWVDLPDELLAKVLEPLEVAGRQEGGLGFSSSTLRPPPRCCWCALPCGGEVKWVPGEWAALTDEALRAVSSLPALTTSPTAPR
jgi:hypothetical protein